MDGKIATVPPAFAWSRERERLQWAVRVRWAVILGFGSLAVALHPLGLFPHVWAVLAGGALGILANAANHVCVRRGRGVVIATVVALILDNLLIAWTSAWTGSFQSPLLIMFSVQVVATAMLVNASAALLSAALAATCVAGLALLESRNAIGASLLLAEPGGPKGLAALAWSACLAYALLLLVFVGGFVSQRLRRREGELAEQNRELADAYQRLQQAEASLLQTEKMRALGQLVAGVAHELNNPISFVSANIDPLREAFQSLVAVVESCVAHAPAEWETRWTALEPLLRDVPLLLDDCAEGARRVKRIVAELRTFSHNGPEVEEAAQSTDLNQRLEQTLHLLRHHFGAGLCLETDLAPLPRLDVLAGQLDQVFLNLVVNAVESLAGAGLIEVRSRYEVEDNRVKITITDDGPGIDAANLSRVFEPFFTTKPVGQGTGVGLSLSYAIVRRHGGQLTVRSPGRGAIFEVDLPGPPKG